MESSQQQPESPAQLVASYTDGFDHSWPPTPVNATATGRGPQNVSQVDGLSRSNSLISPLTSPTSYKPAKRKRLAKACDACHRSKRRCDGTALCANCEFAGKACTYTDPSGRTVAPPRSRGVDGRRAASGDVWPYPTRDVSTGDLDNAPLRMGTPIPTTSDPAISPLDPTLTRELVNLFFAHCQPVTFFVHRPSFLHDLARSGIPSYLLLCVFAVAAPYCLRPILRSNPSWHAGETFANQAARILLIEAQQHVLSQSDSLNSLRIKPCLEVAQALCLLQHHESVMKRPSKTDRFLMLAQEVLEALDVTSMDLPSSLSSYSGHVRNECMRRTFWYIYHTELLSAALTQQTLPTLAEPLDRLRLPVEEGLFDMPRVENRLGLDSTYDYLALPVGHKVCQSEFGNLLRVTCIYAGVVNAVTQKEQALHSWKQGQSSMPEIVSIASLEVDLRKWLELLPDNLRLTEDNLQAHVSQLDGGAGTAAWAFTYMHALAESCVLSFHEFANLGTEKSSRSHSPREQKALDNLTMIMGAMGQRGRANLMMAVLLVAVGKHVSQQHPHFAGWFDEYYRMWGVSYDELMSAEFHAAAWFTTSTPIVKQANSIGYSQGVQNLNFTAQFMESRLSGSDASSNSLSGGASGMLDAGMGSGDNAMQGLSVAALYTRKVPTEGAFFDLTKLGEGIVGSERLGTLATAAAVDGVPQAGPSINTQNALRGFIRRRQAGDRLPHIITSGLSGRGIQRRFYGDGTSLSDGKGESEGSEYHSLEESPTIAGSAQLHEMQTQASIGTRLLVTSQFQTQTSTRSVVTFQTSVDEADLGAGADLSWLEDSGT